MREPQHRAARIDIIENAEPMEKADANEPIDPSDKAEPTDPMDSTDPFDPIDRNESSDHSDHFDGNSLTCFGRLPACLSPMTPILPHRVSGSRGQPPGAPA